MKRFFVWILILFTLGSVIAFFAGVRLDLKKMGSLASSPQGPEETIELTNGSIVHGRIEDETPDTVSLREASGGLVEIPKSDIDERHRHAEGQQSAAKLGSILYHDKKENKLEGLTNFFNQVYEMYRPWTEEEKQAKIKQAKQMRGGQAQYFKAQKAMEKADAEAKRMADQMLKSLPESSKYKKGLQ